MNTYHILLDHKLTNRDILHGQKYIPVFYETSSVTQTQWSEFAISALLILNTTIDSETLCFLTLHGTIKQVSRDDCSSVVLNTIRESLCM